MSTIKHVKLKDPETFEYSAKGRVLRVFDTNGYGDLTPVAYTVKEGGFNLKYAPHGMIYAEVEAHDVSGLAGYQPMALRTEKPLPTQAERIAHAALGLITEVGEYTTEVKRMQIYGKALTDVDEKTKLTRAQHMAEELGDVMWYMAIAADAVGRQLSDLEMEGNRNHGDKDVSLPFYMATLAGHMAYSAQPGVTHSRGKFSEVPGILSDLLWAVRQSAASLDTTLESICEANVAKLQLRFPDAYSNEAAEARADKGGADARNS